MHAVTIPTYQPLFEKAKAADGMCSEMLAVVRISRPSVKQIASETASSHNLPWFCVVLVAYQLIYQIYAARISRCFPQQYWKKDKNHFRGRKNHIDGLVQDGSNTIDNAR